MQSGYQQSTLALAGTLAVISLWRAQHLQHVWSVLATNQNPARLDLRAEVAPIGSDLLAVAILVFLAGLNQTAGKMTVAVSVALWLLFLMSGVAPTPSTALAALQPGGGRGRL